MGHFSLIESLGFRCVGKWRISDKGLDFDIAREVRSAKRSLYAFVENSEVLYVGKASGAFVGRLNGYRRPGTSQRTNLRVNPLLAELVLSNKEVLIYHFQSGEEVCFRNVLLNVAAGLEDPLIEIISPPWNMNGRKKSLAKR